MPQVTENLENLERGIKRYEEVVARAEQRFASVCRGENSGIGVVDKATKPENQLVPIAGRIRELTTTLNTISARLESIIDRAEN